MRPNGLSQGIAVSVVGVVGIDWSDPAGESQDGSTLFPVGGGLPHLRAALPPVADPGRCGAQRKSGP